MCPFVLQVFGPLTQRADIVLTLFMNALRGTASGACAMRRQDSP